MCKCINVSLKSITNKGNQIVEDQNFDLVEGKLFYKTNLVSNWRISVQILVFQTFVLRKYYIINHSLHIQLTYSFTTSVIC